MRGILNVWHIVHYNRFLGSLVAALSKYGPSPCSHSPLASSTHTVVIITPVHMLHHLTLRRGKDFDGLQSSSALQCTCRLLHTLGVTTTSGGDVNLLTHRTMSCLYLSALLGESVRLSCHTLVLPNA